MRSFLKLDTRCPNVCHTLFCAKKTTTTIVINNSRQTLLASEASPLSVHVNRDSWAGCICIGRNFEISLRRRGTVECVCIVHKNERSAHAQIISWQRAYEVKNSCFLVDWSCHLPFKEDSLREGEWVCHNNVIH